MGKEDLLNYGIIGAAILGALMLIGHFTANGAPAPAKANVGTSCGCGH